MATIDVEDVKAEAERLRGERVEVGTVLELHGEIRLLDVFDPDGNRIQLVQELRPMIRRAEPRDVRFLRDMLRHAYYRRERAAGEAEHPVYRYVEAGAGRATRP